MLALEPTLQPSLAILIQLVNSNWDGGELNYIDLWEETSMKTRYTVVVLIAIFLILVSSKGMYVLPRTNPAIYRRLCCPSPVHWRGPRAF